MEQLYEFIGMELNIVLAHYKLHVVLHGEQVGNSINIIYIIAYYPYPCDIVKSGARSVAGEWVSFSLKFFKNALRRFQSVLNMVNWVIVIF